METKWYLRNTETVVGVAIIALIEWKWSQRGGQAGWLCALSGPPTGPRSWRTCSSHILHIIHWAPLTPLAIGGPSTTRANGVRGIIVF